MAVNKILISCNIDDVHLTRICVASIRYYYKDAEIYVIKDYLKGYFDTREIEKVFNVKVIDLGIPKFGWGTAKLHFLLSDLFPNEKILVLDSDIVFVGRVLDYINKNINDTDFAIHCDRPDTHQSEWFRKTYYDEKLIKEKDPEFEYPGYCFNTGQMVVTTHKISGEEIAAFVDINRFPFWKDMKVTPTVDQSLLNYILPKKEKNGQIAISKLRFMIWAGHETDMKLNLEDVKAGGLPFLIHWAGQKRSADISIMVGSEILNFFERYYYQHISFGLLKKQYRLYKYFVDRWAKKYKKRANGRIKALLGR